MFMDIKERPLHSLSQGLYTACRMVSTQPVTWPLHSLSQGLYTACRMVSTQPVT